MRALVIAHEPDGPAGQVGVRLAERGVQVDTHVVTHDMARPDLAEAWPDFADYDLVLPMGSIRNLPNKEPIESWIHDELRLLSEAHERGQPILGICFGGQLMAEALGGTVEVSPEPEIGWLEITALPGMDNPAGPGPWMLWHHDRFTAPPGAQVLAQTDHALQLFRLGTTVGTQFHPEVDAAHIRDWLSVCDDDYLASLDTNRGDVQKWAVENEERNIKQCHAFVDWWLDEVVGLAESQDQVSA